MNADVVARFESGSLAEFCRRWKVTELSLFGSALRQDFGEDSDIDLLISFAPDSQWSLLDHIRMEEQLTQILGHDVDLVTRRAVERSHNWIRRNAILQDARVVYQDRDCAHDS